MIRKYTFGWLALVVVAIINGALREAVYKPSVGDLAAHQISTLTGIFLFGLLIWGMSRLWPIQSAGQAWGIGFIWLGMTICFEFLFGHYVMGHSWSTLFHDYNVFEGRLWILVLLWTVSAPYVFFRFFHHGR
jgi:hypothetical protein